MSSNYPPGVTGGEYQIAGPDSEEEIKCPNCGRWAVLVSYHGERWVFCDFEDETFDDPNPLPEPDPDRAYDEARERRLFGDD